MLLKFVCTQISDIYTRNDSQIFYLRDFTHPYLVVTCS
eukprot:UN02071